MHNEHDRALEPHRLSPEQVFGRLASSPRGLTQTEAEQRLRHEGPNQLTRAARVSLASRLRRHLGHGFALLLWAGAFLAFLGEHFSPGQGMALIARALTIVVLLNGAFSLFQEARAERAMAAFRRMLSPHARVLRDGHEVELDAARVVQGDVLLLRAGDRVSADARLFEATGLRVDQAMLTGESEPQPRRVQSGGGRRQDSKNLVFAGTLVTSGTGRAVVYAIGDGTELGRVAAVTRETARVETPISRELRRAVRVITVVAISLGAVFFVIGGLIGKPFWTSLVFALGLIIANVPEGLLPTVTLALAIAGRKMAKRKALLKTLESAETLGSTSVICTDKTGTLTQNEMVVTDLILPGELESSASRAEDDSSQLETALDIIVLCNNAEIETGEAGVHALGDPTEASLVRYAETQQRGFVGLRRAACPRLYERPFDSATREMATLNQLPDHREALLKGAPEVILDRCSQILRGGTEAPLSSSLRAAIGARADVLASQGRRVLALAHKPLADEGDPERALAQGNYRFAGLVAMQDPPRPEVMDAVASCRRAGIRIVVVSGDHPRTVQAVARQVGITQRDDVPVYTSAELTSWSKPALRHALARDSALFARTSPLDKLRIVRALQEMGHVVAVTGDGVNDAPALKRADVGVAMGQTGTEVAREAADMVLMDDNFATIVAAIEEGRVIYGNIRRFIGYVLTSNVAEFLPYIAYVLWDIPLPLPLLLVLAIDLGTDMMPAIALASETAESDVMRLPPRSRSERLLSLHVVLSAYLLWGVLEALSGFAAYFWVLRRGGFGFGAALSADHPLYRQAVSAFFASVVICQVANVLVWRTTSESVIKKGILQNRAVLLGVAFELSLLVAIVETELGHALFGTASLPLSAWLFPLPFALAMLVLSELLKALSRKRQQSEQAAALTHPLGL